MPLPASGWVQAIAEFLAGSKMDHRFAVNRDRCAGAGVAPKPCLALAQGKCAEAAQLDPTAIGKFCADLLEDSVDDPLDIGTRQMGVEVGELGDEFALDHYIPHFEVSYWHSGEIRRVGVGNFI